MKNKKKKVLVILILIIILLIAGILIYKLSLNKNDEPQVKVIKSIEEYNYNLNDNETKLYKTEFDNLYDILTNDEVDYEAYAKSVAKLFVIDFYTLDNKLSKNDIGGTDFIKDSMKDNFIEEARSTFYKYLEVKNDERMQRLPIVNEITDVLIENTTFTYADKTIDENAYKVTISWNYEEDLGYETTAKMIIVKEDKKLYIVEMD